MRGVRAFLGGVLVSLCGAMAAPAPTAVYGQLPTLTDVTLSPDGASLAYIRGAPSKRAIVIQSLAAPRPPVVIDATGKKVRSLLWAGSNHLIITTSTTAVPKGVDADRGEFTTAQDFNLSKNALVPLLEHVSGASDQYFGLVFNILISEPQPRMIAGHAVVYLPGLMLWKDRVSDALYRADLDTGETTRVWSFRDGISGAWQIDEKGDVVAAQGVTRLTQHWFLNLYRGGEFYRTALAIPSPIDVPGVVGFTEDGAAIVVEPPPKVDGISYLQVSLADGSVKPWQHPLAGKGALMTDARTGRIIGAEHVLDRTDYSFLDPALDSLWKSAKAAFAAATEVSLVSWTDDKTKAVLRVFGPQIGYGYYILDMTAKKAFPVGPAYDGLSEIYDRKWITYAAADGRSLYAYLTLPKGADKNLPLVVLPHGGPHARDEPGFDWISQALAARGYAVLQPQFRGSDGFGQELLAAGFGEFGKKMQTDLSDGVRTLAAQGVIDAKRVCIVGASYGGYAALAGATLDTGVYRCAVSIAGMSDMRDMMSDWPRPTMSTNSARFWDRFLGMDGNWAKLDAISPIKHIDKVTIPILLIHGRDDTVVQYSQSEDMANALRRAGKRYEFVTLDAEDHWLSSSATRQQMLDATVRFLEANNPPK
jgi:dienelactone hydrolase